MKLYHYLNEKYIELQEGEMDFLIDRWCQPWLKASSGKQVFRGISTKPENFKGIVRKDRNPMNTPQVIQDIFDDTCKKKFGWKPRSSGLFVSGDVSQARSYGDDYAIYPIGDFKFLWSPTISDFYIDISIISSNYEGSRDKVFKEKAFQEEVKAKIIKSYSDKNLKKAIKSGQEIMIKCNEYYAKFNR